MALLLLASCYDPMIPRASTATLDDSGSDGFVQVSAGKEHTCAVTAAGTAYCWGSNEFGQLGAASDTVKCMREDRPIECRRAPVAVATTLSFRLIRAGGAHTCALATDGRVYCWGDNLRGALGDPAVRTSAAPNPVVSSETFVDLSVGGNHSCALRGDGAAFCWGSNLDGQLGIATVGAGAAVPTQTQTSQRFVSLAAGERRTCARLGDGTPFCWGAIWVTRQNGVEVTRSQGLPLRLVGAPVFAAIAVGSHTTCGVTPDDRAFCWEANPTGSMGDGSRTGSTIPKLVNTSLRFVRISVGAFHSCAIGEDGFAYCWGSDASGQLGVSPASLDGRCGAPAAAGTSCAVTPIRVMGRRIYSEITAGQGDHTCALTLAGNIYCWGAGALGQRGDGRTTNEWSPTKTRSP